MREKVLHIADKLKLRKRQKGMGRGAERTNGQRKGETAREKEGLPSHRLKNKTSEGDNETKLLTKPTEGTGDRDATTAFGPHEETIGERESDWDGRGRHAACRRA